MCVDAGEGAEVGRRWALAHALGPVLLAAFANSPRLHGRRTGWKSSRWQVWANADPARTDAYGFPLHSENGEAAELCRVDSFRFR